MSMGTVDADLETAPGSYSRGDRLEIEIIRTLSKLPPTDTIEYGYPRGCQDWESPHEIAARRRVRNMPVITFRFASLSAFRIRLD